MARRNTNPAIFLPGGGAVRRAEVVAFTVDEMRVIRDFHAIAQKYDLGLHCSHCGKDIQGKNTGHEAIFAIECECREFRGPRS